MMCIIRKDDNFPNFRSFCLDGLQGRGPRVIVNKTNNIKRELNDDLKIREALKIWRQNCGPGKGLNED